MYNKSVREPRKFWDKIADENFTWYQRWDKVFDFDMQAAEFKWFVNAKLNITKNCIDRHLARRGDKTAIIFEPNNPATWTRFKNKVNPILENYRRDQGINRFKVVMDESTNSADVIDRNEMKGKIFLEPVRAAEFITVDFIITASGVAFGS